MNVAFRVDSSLQIGSGHAMRCLALAEALRECSARCVFVAREQVGNSLHMVESRGFEVRRLPASPAQQLPLTGYASWLGASWEADAAQTLQALADHEVWDWLVVDHYAIDRRWELIMRAACRRLLVIDDLADRPHEADFLLDQTLGRLVSDYAPLVNDGCELQCGVEYALLRPEFAAWRSASLARRANAPLERILVSLGGIDRDNLTRRVLLALDACAGPARVLVVLGASAPWTEDIRVLARGLAIDVEVRAGVDNMAELMVQSDLAIGAAGSSAWERCCLGLPTLMLVLAENQQKIADELAQGGAAWLLPLDAGFEKALAVSIATLSGDVDMLGEMSQRAAALVPAGGTAALAARMTTSQAQQVPPRLRALASTDLTQVLAWRNDPAIRRHMYTAHAITPAEHAAWFERASRDRSRSLLVLEIDGAAAAYMSFARGVDATSAIWGFYTAPQAPPGTGRLLAGAALEHGFKTLGLSTIIAEVLADNLRSQRFHEQNGFRLTRVDEISESQGLQRKAVHHYVLARSVWQANQGKVHD